ncbi:MAG: alpha-amylase family protein [Synechococcales cyanobacterium C42_A2020_086]|jgi:maltose alpha-D-glucosyltransferase/alpha-amylase|nr:alpha-amylase family protein [Synechococcales cyanobacterium C42_A2020_086]
MESLWYKNAIVYVLDVETFMDSNGDGIGDFPGLTQRLDYLSGLGITCLWLHPFYPSPNRDDGYDVMDYYGVDPCLGTLGDFVEFMHACKERGIRVLIDLVVNHTSIQHPWFQAARSDRHSKYRDYYIWSDDPPPTDPAELVFPDVEDSIWEYDEQAGAYYLHHFYKEQPDLNISNPVVRDEIRKIIHFWLQLGVSGFRVDAVPYFVKNVEGLVEQYELESFLEDLRCYVSSWSAEAVLLAEANVESESFSMYFGDGNRMHMLFSFFANQKKFLALARQDATPLIEGLRQLPHLPRSGQWLNFVRHHDELTLDQLGDAERDEVFHAFAPEANMQIYGRGIRRRLPPMLNSNRRHIELVYSLLFTLPGIPLLRYGDEIGMGDDLSLPDRDSVRTPMQWSDEPNGGFSSAAHDRLAKPVISEGDYSYKRVNVAAQQPDPNSLLNWMSQVIRMRRQCPEFGWGDWDIIETDEPCVFAHRCQWRGKALIAVHNLANRACTVTLKSNPLNQLVDLFGNCASPTPTECQGERYYRPLSGSQPISLEPYGYRWFRVEAKSD